MGKRLPYAIVCLVAGGLLLTGVLHAPLRAGLERGLGQRAEDYLDHSLQRAVAGFASASAVKGVLALVEGSEVGFSLVGETSIEVGDLIQPTYDYVDIAWRTLFTGSLVLLCLRLLLETSYAVAPWIAGAGLLLLGVVLLLDRGGRHRRRWRAVVRDGATFAVVLTLAVAFVLPLSVLGAARLSAWITAPQVEEAHAELAALERQVAPEDGGSVFSDPRRWKERVENLVRTVGERGEDLIVTTLRLVAGYLFDCVLFPLALFYLGLRLARMLVAYAVARARTEEMVGALEEARPGAAV
jgi:hypothetical protein